MTLIPDTRNDRHYNEKFLNRADKNFIDGYDCAIDVIRNHFMSNLDNFEEELNYVPEEDEKQDDEVYSNNEHLFDILEENKEIIDYMIEFVSESEINQIITGIIENMSDEEYESIKSKVPKEELEKMYDTRKLYCTGKKE